MIIMIGDSKRHELDAALQKTRTHLNSAFVMKDKNNREAIVETLVTCIKPHLCHYPCPSLSLSECSSLDASHSVSVAISVCISGSLSLFIFPLCFFLDSIFRPLSVCLSLSVCPSDCVSLSHCGYSVWLPFVATLRGYPAWRQFSGGSWRTLNANG